LVLKNPTVLSKTKGQINFFFDYFNRNKQIDEKTLMKLVFEVPVLLNVDIALKAKEIEELFKVYHQMTSEDVKSIFLDFPYLYCCPSHKIQKFLAEFRKYRLTKEQILNLSKNSGGLLGCKPSNLVGFFNYLKWEHEIKASEVVRILDDYPELALQNRQDMIKKKFNLIKKNNHDLSDIYLRNLFRRHPDLFLKSYASMQAKVTYLTRTLNMQL